MKDYSRNQEELRLFNTFLEGERAAVGTYETVISTLTDPTMVPTLKRLKSNHQDRVSKLAQEIIAMGGTPQRESGVWGEIAQVFAKRAKRLSQQRMMEVLVQGEENGTNMYHNNLKALPFPTMNLVKRALPSMIPSNPAKGDRLKPGQRVRVRRFQSQLSFSSFSIKLFAF